MHLTSMGDCTIAGVCWIDAIPCISQVAWIVHRYGIIAARTSSPKHLVEASMPKKTLQPLDLLLLMNAYAQGIFPMADHRGDIHWYAPDPRAILEHDNLHVSHSLRATIRKGIYEVRMDTAFELVMRHCAARKETWINEALIVTYTGLHHAGLAHSVEAWRNGVLAGGLYGVALRGAFMGESMFSYATNASKVCLVALVEHLKARGYV